MNFWIEYTAILLGITVMYFLFRFWLYNKMKGLEGKPAHALSTVPGTDPKGNYLLYFYTPDCGACRMMTPVIDRMMESGSENGQHIKKIDASVNTAAARAFSIMGTPTLILVSEGTIRTVKVGAAREKEIESLASQL